MKKVVQIHKTSSVRTMLFRALTGQSVNCPIRELFDLPEDYDLDDDRVVFDDHSDRLEVEDYALQLAEQIRLDIDAERSKQAKEKDDKIKALEDELKLLKEKGGIKDEIPPQS